MRVRKKRGKIKPDLKDTSRVGCVGNSTALPVVSNLCALPASRVLGVSLVRRRFSKMQFYFVSNRRAILVKEKQKKYCLI